MIIYLIIVSFKLVLLYVGLLSVFICAMCDVFNWLRMRLMWFIILGAVKIVKNINMNVLVRIIFTRITLFITFKINYYSDVISMPIGTKSSLFDIFGGINFLQVSVHGMSKNMLPLLERDNANQHTFL